MSRQFAAPLRHAVLPDRPFLFGQIRLAAFGEEDPDFLVPDEAITSIVDVSPYTDAKFDSLAAHASQAENIFFLGLGRENFSEMFRRESFIRVQDRTGAPVPEADLFAGLR